MPLSRYWQVVLSLVFLSFPVWAQQTSSSSQTELRPNETPKPVRDTQAIDVLNRAVAVAGGMETLAAIRDYRATGTINYEEQGRQVQGAVTLTGSGVALFRMDENLPSGNRSEATDSGNAWIKSENGRIRKLRGQTPLLPGGFAVPHRQLVTLLRDKNIAVSYKGAAPLEGTYVHQIQVQRLYPRALDPSGLKTTQSTKTFSIDAATFQVIMVQDSVPPGIPRKTRYSDFRQISGKPVPFSIVEEMDRKARSIRLDNIGFNLGLQKTDFNPSAR